MGYYLWNFQFSLQFPRHPSTGRPVATTHSCPRHWSQLCQSIKRCQSRIFQTLIRDKIALTKWLASGKFSKREPNGLSNQLSSKGIQERGRAGSYRTQDRRSCLPLCSCLHTCLASSVNCWSASNLMYRYICSPISGIHLDIWCIGHCAIHSI